MNYLLKYKKIFIFTLFLVIGSSLYGNTFNNEFFWDDDDSIVNNAYIKNWDNLDKFFTENLIAGAGQVTNYYRPVLLISFAFDYQFWELEPFGYHLTNMLLHVFNAFLVFLILSLLGKCYKKELSSEASELSSYFLPFLVSLIFLVHPLQTEAVTYVAGRADPLSSFFSLLAIFYFVKIHERNNNTQKKRINKYFFVRYFAALLFFVLGLLTKEQVILLPVLSLLIEAVFFFKKIDKKNIIKSAKLLLPLFLISLIYFLIRIFLLNFNDLLAGAEYSSDYDTNIINRIFTFGWVIILYFKLLFIPTGLHMAREVGEVGIVQFIVFLISLFIILIICIKTWRKDRLITFGFLWFFIILLPRTNILPINRPMYEHWLYLPMIGFWLAIFSLFILLFGWVKIKYREKVIYLAYIYFILYIFLLVFLSVLTIIRNNDWQNPIVFYEKNLKFTPNSYIQHNNLGMAYSIKNRSEDAVKEYKLAISINDKYPQVHSNLANSLHDLGQIDEAIDEYKIAIKMSPTFSIPYYNLLSIYLNINNREETVRLLESMEVNFRDDKIFNYNAGVAYFTIKNYEAAILHWRRILENNPNEKNVRELIKEAKAKNSNIQ